MLIIEILGLVFGLLYLFSNILEKWITWPLGIIAVALYGYSCWQSSLYGELSLQFIYLFLSFYGWWNWTKNKSTPLLVEKLEYKYYLLVLIASLALSIFFYVILQKINSSIPALDAISNGFSIVATYLATKKKIENWLLWIPIDILIAYMMFVKGMPFYMILYIFYSFFAILGYIQWKKNLKIQDIKGLNINEKKY